MTETMTFCAVRKREGIPEGIAGRLLVPGVYKSMVKGTIKSCLHHTFTMPILSILILWSHL